MDHRNPPPPTEPKSSRPPASLCLLTVKFANKAVTLHNLPNSYQNSAKCRSPMPADTSPDTALELRLSHLRQLEAESIHILREVAAEFENPVMLYSIGKDSAVMVHLARKAFHRGKLPFPLLHIDTTWKFKAMIEFRDRFCKEHGFDLRVHTNQQGLADNINPFDHGSNKYTQIMKTQALLQALQEGGYDAAFGGARRDEERSRAKERIYSFRDRYGQWDPKNQRPELWNVYNAKINKGESIRAFPLSNWTELDIWLYVWLENIEIVPLYLSAPRPVVDRQGTLIMVDDDRMKLERSEEHTSELQSPCNLVCRLLLQKKKNSAPPPPNEP